MLAAVRAPQAVSTGRPLADGNNPRPGNHPRPIVGDLATRQVITARVRSVALESLILYKSNRQHGNRTCAPRKFVYRPDHRK